MNYAQGMLYEVARELISSKIANISHELGVEESKASPDEERIRQLESEQVAFAREREMLVPEDEHSVRSVILRYGRGPLVLDIE